MVDAGQTYRLEGDGPLVFQAYEEIVTVRATVHTTLMCIRPGLQYFET